MRERAVDHEVPTDLAPVLGARRDGSATVETTRGLLMTMLGEFVLPAGGEAWTRTLVAGLELLGVQEKAARQALSRLEADGWLTRARIGRQARWSLTDRAARLLEEGAERIYGFGRTDRSWDGEWVVLLASVPERERATRYRMAQRLSWVGFGPLGQAVWVCPWTTQEAVAQRVLADLGVEATSFRGAVGAVGSADAVAGRAWSLGALADAYDQFLSEFVAEIEVGDAASAAVELTRLVHAWRKFPFLDPDLPAELLPAAWPGHRATELFAERRARLSEPARTWWQQIENG